MDLVYNIGLNYLVFLFLHLVKYLHFICSSISFCFLMIGERALRDIIKQARQVGMLANDQQIKDLCDNLDGLVDRLSALRAQGLVRFIGFKLPLFSF